MATIQVRIDDDLKTKADRLFKDLGTDTTSAIRMFLTQAVENDGFPFEIKKRGIRKMSEKEFYECLLRAREQAQNNQTIDADDFISDMKSKYGL